MNNKKPNKKKTDQDQLSLDPYKRAILYTDLKEFTGMIDYEQIFAARDKALRK